MSAFYSRGHSELEMMKTGPILCGYGRLDVCRKEFWNSHARCWNRL